MVPVSRDDSGCQQYSAWSSSKVVPAVIYYRMADNTFTMFRSKADCSDQS